jgi:hypothetical protein
MEKNFTFKNRNYSYNPETRQISLVTDSGAKVPVSPNHPSLRGIMEHVEENVATA